MVQQAVPASAGSTGGKRTITAPWEKREAAKLLGIDRGRTLGALIALGKLRVVPWGNGERIPLTDVERLAREGWTVPQESPGRAPASRQRRERPRAGTLSDAEVRARLAEF